MRQPLLSTTRFLFLLAVLYPSFSVFFRPLNDPDFWWHLKAGEVIVQNFSLPESDPFSYTATEPSRFYSWLPEVCFYLLYQAAGFTGVKLFLALLLALFACRWWNFFFQMHPRPTICFVAVTFTSFMVGSIAGPRPQFISYLLLGQLLLLILEMEMRFSSTPLEEAKKNFRLFLFLPFLFLIWANSHILFVVGLLFWGIYACAKSWPLLLEVPVLELAQNFSVADLSARLKPARQNLYFLWVWLGCILATLINPYGHQLFVESLMHATHRWSWIHIAEVQPANPRISLANLYYLLAIFSIVWLTLYRSVFFLWEWMLALLALFLPFTTVKFLPVSFLVTLPILSRRVSFSGFASAENFKFSSLLNFLILFSATISICFQFLRAQTVPNPYPENAVNFLLKSFSSGNLANHYNDGSYLLYRLWPQRKVFIYSRAPIFSERFLKEDFGGLLLEEGGKPWQQVLDQYKIELVLWPNSHPLIFVLEAAGWKKIYWDEKFSIFQRPRSHRIFLTE